MHFGPILQQIGQKKQYCVLKVNLKLSPVNKSKVEQ